VRIRSGWRAETVAGLVVLRCEALLAVPGVAHAFSTRCADGGDDFDLGRADRCEPDWTSRRRRLGRAAGIGHGAPAVLTQVHGGRLMRAADCDPGAPPRADGVLALRPGKSAPAPAVRVADCVPVLLATRDGAAVAAVHAGWRGTAAGIVQRAVERLETLGVRPRDLVAAMGPAIGACCYEVSDDVVQAVAGASGASLAQVALGGAGERAMLDLRRANRLQLVRAGLKPEAVHVAPWCTACSPAWFFSYRRDGAVTGRMMACIGWTGGGEPGRSLTPAPP
jgi:YfiH family protein